jgi:HSP20 family protein
MNLIRWQPLEETEYLQRSMNRLFDSLNVTNGEGKNLRHSFVPAAEIQETAEAINLSLEAPGMNAKDLDTVSISGERKEETVTEDKGMTRTEFRYGRFQRVIPLPARIQNTNVHAEYKDGILKLVLPKAEEEKNKIVKVNVD